MKKFLIFVLGLAIGGLVVYCFFPNTVKSQKTEEGYLREIDSLSQDAERLAEKLKVAEQQKPQTPKPAAQQSAPKQGSTSQPKQTAQPSDNLGKKYFENAVEYGGRKSFQVKKVLDSGDAFAEEVTRISSEIVFTDYNSKVLLERDPEMPYYDSQLVQASGGKRVLQLGIYRYKESKYLDAKTIPIIAVR